MDKIPLDIETETLLNHTLAECESLKAQLEEYRYIIIMRDRDIENLRMKLAEKAEFKSNTDNQEEELRLLQDSVHLLKIKASGGMGISETGNQLRKTDSYAEFELEDMQQKTIHLQTQLADLQERLSELTNRNLLLQQEASRTGELEELLERTARERDELKHRSCCRMRSNFLYLAFVQILLNIVVSLTCTAIPLFNIYLSVGLDHIANLSCRHETKGRLILIGSIFFN